MAAKKEHEYFVNIESPVEVRRNLLESSRDIIHMLQSHEKIRLMRDDKNRLLQQLDNVMKDIYSISNKLRTELPKLPAKKKETKVEKKAQPAKEKKKAPVVVKQNIVPKEKSALELLEEELLNVEKQLNDIN